MQPSQELFKRPRNVQSRWASFENPDADKGAGGQTNRGGKGRPFQSIPAGQTVTLLDTVGSGIINRIWLTISDRRPQTLRALRIDIYWDGATTPAVSAPLGDFFGIALGRRVAFESELFSDPEGRSFNCFVPMPFRTGARITISNESGDDVGHLFYDVNFLQGVEHDDDTLYFHAHWRRENPNILGQDFTILPSVSGSGRYLGTNMGVIVDPIYDDAWWGEGEVKVWLDGDGEFPTLCGTGTEDYIGSAWTQGLYAHRTQGCTVVDEEKGYNAFYRYHTVDPVYFSENCRVVIQTMGGAREEKVAQLQLAEAPMVLASLTLSSGLIPLLTGDYPFILCDSTREQGGINFYRQDDWCATAYFYLHKPENELPPLASVEERTRGLN